MILIPLFIFALGLIVGSFLNVVILRMNTGRSVAKGRSACMRCNTTLSWYELIPVFSFLFQRGKCRSCKTSISFQYPLVELVTAIVFVLLYNRFILTTLIVPATTTLGIFTAQATVPFIFSLAIASILIVIFAYDYRHKIIPDTAVYSFIILTLLGIVWKTITIADFSFAQAIVNGIVLATPFFGLWFFSKGRAMGFGDIKLVLGMGWLLGLSQGISAVMLAFWIGAIIGLLLIAFRRRYSLQSEIPFGPFLIIGTFIAGVWGFDIMQLIMGGWN